MKHRCPHRNILPLHQLLLLPPRGISGNLIKVSFNLLAGADKSASLHRAITRYSCEQTNSGGILGDREMTRNAWGASRSSHLPPWPEFIHTDPHLIVSRTAGIAGIHVSITARRSSSWRSIVKIALIATFAPSCTEDHETPYRRTCHHPAPVRLAKPGTAFKPTKQQTASRQEESHIRDGSGSPGALSR